MLRRAESCLPRKHEQLCALASHARGGLLCQGGSFHRAACPRVEARPRSTRRSFARQGSHGCWDKSHCPVARSAPRTHRSTADPRGSHGRWHIESSCPTSHVRCRARLARSERAAPASVGTRHHPSGAAPRTRALRERQLGLRIYCSAGSSRTRSRSDLLAKPVVGGAQVCAAARAPLCDRPGSP